MIEVNALTKTFGSHHAVDQLSFTAAPGEVTGFLGPNGAGKTTTFRCLLGLAEPTSGTALVNGRRYRNIASPRHEVGAVLESTRFHPARTGRNHLRVLARGGRLDSSRIDNLLELVGLSSAADRRVGGYSLGMRQRLGLAAAMLGDPAVVVLDEPSNGLDPAGVSWVRQLLRIWADEGRTVLVSSHLLAEVAQVADRVVVISGGALVGASAIAGLDERVIVRVDRVDDLLPVLRSSGAAFELLDDGAVVVMGRDAAEIGAMAAQSGVVVLELTKTAPADALEAMFLSVTGGAVS